MQTNRRGPLTKFPHGQYVGSSVEEVIRKDPRYFMWCVKEWLNVSPKQAEVFEEVTGGGTIPECYVISPLPKKEPQSSPLTQNKQMWWEDDYDLPCWPDWDYWGLEKPKWWEEFMKRAETLTMSQAKDLYAEYQMKDIREQMKYWNKEYDEYRKTHRQE